MAVLVVERVVKPESRKREGKGWSEELAVSGARPWERTEFGSWCAWVTVLWELQDGDSRERLNWAWSPSEHCTGHMHWVWGWFLLWYNSKPQAVNRLGQRLVGLASPVQPDPEARLQRSRAGLTECLVLGSKSGNPVSHTYASAPGLWERGFAGGAGLLGDIIEGLPRRH